MEIKKTRMSLIVKIKTKSFIFVSQDFTDSCSFIKKGTEKIGLNRFIFHICLFKYFIILNSVIILRHRQLILINLILTIRFENLKII
jgi:hypothetical protein